MDYSTFPQEVDIIAGVSWETRVGYNTDNLGTMRITFPYHTHDKHIQYNGTTYDGIGEAKGLAVDIAEEGLYAIAQSAFTATVYAQRNGISRSEYYDMPLMYLLGDSLTFMLRDVIQYAGNYDDIYNEAFVSSDGDTEIGWNIVIPVSTSNHITVSCSYHKVSRLNAIANPSSSLSTMSYTVHSKY